MNASKNGATEGGIPTFPFGYVSSSLLVLALSFDQWSNNKKIEIKLARSEFPVGYASLKYT